MLLYFYGGHFLGLNSQIQCSSSIIKILDTTELLNLIKIINSCLNYADVHTHTHIYIYICGGACVGANFKIWITF